MSYFVNVIPVLSASLLLACTRTRQSGGPGEVERVRPPATHAVGAGAEYPLDSLAFLRRAIGNRSVVQLGESIHMTHEFPEIRIPILRFLNERMGFGVVAFEGSEVDAWLAMDQLLSTTERGGGVSRAQSLAWFGLWQTKEMTDVMSVIARSQASDHPLYLASFDVQPGSSPGTGPAVIPLLLQAMVAYGKPSRDVGTIAQRLSGVPGCGAYRSAAAGPPPTSDQVADAVDALDRWTHEIAPVVAARRSVIHARMLLSISANLRDAFALCSFAPGLAANPERYQAARDSINAKNVLALRSISENGKVVLWAHHSHTNYNSLKVGVASLGQRLRAQISEEMYSIGLFAGDGQAILLDATPDGRPAVATLTLNGCSAETLLSKVTINDGPTYVELSSARERADQPWSDSLTTRWEGKCNRATRLVTDYDGAVYVPHVTTPSFMSQPQK